MVKANAIFELLLYNFFYKDKFVVYVEKPNNSIEKHYFDVDTEGRVIIYKPDSDRYEDNPFVKGSAVHFDSKHKAPILLWREGETFAIPLFGSTDFDSQKTDSQYGFRMVNLGKRLQELNNPILKSQKTEGYIMYMMIASLVLSVIMIVLIWQLAVNQGINLLS